MKIFILMSLFIPTLAFSAAGVPEQDGTSPEQIAVFLPDDSYADSITATMRYRTSSPVGSWVTGHELFQINDYSARISIDEAGFAWVITGLEQGTDYDVEVTTWDGATPTVLDDVVMSTSSLPAACGSVDYTITSGMNETQMEAEFAKASAGDTILIENGTYTTTGLATGTGGSAGSPVCIQGETRSGVIISDTTGEVFKVNTGYIIIENMTISGSGVDDGVGASSVGIDHSQDGTPTEETADTGITLRRLNITGVDKAFYSSDHVNQLMIYECVFQGNNAWDQDFYSYGGSGSPGGGDGTKDTDQNIFWNDTAIVMGGTGNVVFNNTISGFGDTVKAYHGNPGTGIHFYRNDVSNAGDDGFEADNATRNLTVYDNRFTNTMTCVSADTVNGGPLIVFRNICLNVGRQMWKFGSANRGLFYYNNTVLHTVTTANTDKIWSVPNNGWVESVGWQNNIFIYQNKPVGGYSFYISPPDLDPIDWTHNAYYPDDDINWSNTSGLFDDLADAKATMDTTVPEFSGSTEKHDNDEISELQPFTTEVALGADYYTEVTIKYTPTLTASGVSDGTGTAIVGVTDNYDDASPDRGAIISGRDLVTYGATISTTSSGISASGVSFQ